MCVCRCTCIYRCACMCEHLCESKRTVSYFITQVPPSCLFKTGSPLAWYLPRGLVWLANQFLDSTRLHFPSTGITSTHYTVWLLYIKLRSSCLQSKQFTDWAIFLSRLPSLFSLQIIVLLLIWNNLWLPENQQREKEVGREGRLENSHIPFTPLHCVIIRKT